MIAALRKLFSPAPYVEEAHRAYVALVNQSRNPWFFSELAVPDTIDGRFDLVLLHMHLLVARLREESPEFVRALCECFIADMDRNLREMGVSDTGVGKRVKKMIQAFYGRLKAYDDSTNTDALTATIARNIYRSDTRTPAAYALAQYYERCCTLIAGQPTDTLLQGKIFFMRD